MICATRGPPESDSLRWNVARNHDVPSQTAHPAIKGTRAHHKLWVAESVTRPIRTIPTMASRRPSTSMLLKPSARSTGGPTTAGRPRRWRSAKRSAFARSSAITSFRPNSSELFSRTTSAVPSAFGSISVPTKRGCLTSLARRSATPRASADLTAPPTVRALPPVSSTFLIAFRIALKARLRANPGIASIAIRPSSTFQSKGMTSIDSTRSTPRICFGPTSRVNSPTRSMPAGVRSPGS